MVELWWRFDFDALVFDRRCSRMIEYYSTVKENGFGYAQQVADELRQKGYKILDGPFETMVPRGERSDGSTIMVPGYRIKVDDGRPIRTPIIS